MNLQDKIVQIDSLKDTYYNKLKLGALQLPSEAEKYLNLTDMQNLSADILFEAACILYQSVNYIQKDLNKHQANYNWCHRYLQYLVAKDLENVGGQYTPFEMKKMLVVQNNDVAFELNKLMSEIQLYIDSMHDIPYNIRMLASSYEKLAQSKRILK